MNNMWGAVPAPVEWGWEIVLYLFLAGLSAGSTMVALLVKWNRHDTHETNTIWDAMVKSGAIIAPLSITIGLALLIYDLARPWTFFLLLIKYNPTSVMSIGVILLLIYTPISYIFALIIFGQHISHVSFVGKILDTIAAFAKAAKPIEKFLFILAIGVAIYTGFLLSVAQKFELWNTPILPLLFLMSALSSGIAACILVGIVFFKATLNKESIKYLLVLDLRVILFELPLIALLFIGISFDGGEIGKFFSDAYYGRVFWVGVIAVGLLLPVIIALTALRNHAYKQGFILLNSIAVIIGVIMLRYYIVFAGQALA